MNDYYPDENFLYAVLNASGAQPKAQLYATYDEAAEAATDKSGTAYVFTYRAPKKPAGRRTNDYYPSGVSDLEKEAISGMQARIERGRRVAADLRTFAGFRDCPMPNLLEDIAHNIQEALR